MATWSDILHTDLEIDYLAKWNTLVTRCEALATTVETWAAAIPTAVAQCAASAATALAQAIIATAQASAASSSAASAAAAWTAALAANPDLNPAVRMNPSSISADLTVASYYNAYCAGPITIGEGVTVTLNDNSNWSVL